MWLRNLAGFAGLCLSAPALAAAPFALCLYGVNNPSDVKTVRKAGFNCFQTYQQDPALLSSLAKQAQKQGMEVVFYPNKVLGSAFEQEAQNWPMLAWYLVDEPDVAHWSRARVLQAYNAAKAAFPRHLTALVIGQGRTNTPFYDLPDILMMDWYPVPHLPLTSFGDQLALARRGMQQHGAGANPLWGVVQAFDWKEYKQYRPDEDRIGRFPTEEELRFMSYHGIVNGVSGLFYFIFTTEGVPLPQARPDWWKRLKTVTRELAKFRPVLEQGTPAPAPADIKAPFLAKTWHYKKAFYTVLLNTSAQAQPLPPALLHKKYKALFGRKKTPTVPPFGVLVLKNK